MARFPYLTRGALAIAALLYACSSDEDSSTSSPAAADNPSSVGFVPGAPDPQGFPGSPSMTGSPGPAVGIDGASGTPGGASMMGPPIPMGDPAGGFGTEAGASMMESAPGDAAPPAGADADGSNMGAAAPNDTEVAIAPRPLSSTLGLPITQESPGVAPYFNVWRPEDLAAVEGPLPVVVWNNGACSRNDRVFKPLFEMWASGGYFVLSLTSGGGSSMTTIDDQQGLIDWVVAQAEMAGGPYEGKLDLQRIAAGGNSCGGITSLGLASMDERVASVFVLSGSSAIGRPNGTVIDGVQVPVAYIVGGEEDIARANAEADYEAFSDGLPAMIVKRSSGDHLEISNGAEVMTDAADISINWFDLTMFGVPEALDALNMPTVCDGCQSGLWTLTSKNLEALVK